MSNFIDNVLQYGGRGEFAIGGRTFVKTYNLSVDSSKNERFAQGDDWVIMNHTYSQVIARASNPGNFAVNGIIGYDEVLAVHDEDPENIWQETVPWGEFTVYLPLDLGERVEVYEDGTQELTRAAEIWVKCNGKWMGELIYSTIQAPILEAPPNQPPSPTTTYPRWRCVNAVCEQYQAPTPNEGFATRAECEANCGGSGSGSNPRPPVPGPGTPCDLCP